MRTVLPLLVLAATACTVCADDPAPTGDLAKLQGTWTAMIGPDKAIKITITIKGTAATIAMALPGDSDFESDGQIRVDGAARPHKTIDFTRFTRPDGEPVRENLGIYEIDGDALRLCTGGPGNPRPTEFKAGEGGPPNLVILKRGGAAAAGPAELKGDLARLQGTWSTKVGPKKDIPIALTFKGTETTLVITARNGMQYRAKGEIKIDEAARPQTIDFIKFTRARGEPAPENLGIYEFEDDALRLCTGGPGNARPSEFKAGEKGPPNLIVLRREKE